MYSASSAKDLEKNQKQESAAKEGQKIGKTLINSEEVQVSSSPRNLHYNNNQSQNRKTPGSYYI